MVANSELWRNTELGHRVFETFNDEEIARLEGWVEEVGFCDSELQKEFPELIRQWALRWLHEIEGTKYRRMPDGRGRRDSDRNEVASNAQWKRVVKDITRLKQSLEGLPPGTKAFLFGDLARETNKSLRQIVASWPNGRSPLTQLVHLLDRAKMAAPPLKKRGGKTKPHTEAIHHLARIWVHVTGSRPQISYSEARGGYEGPFYDFANDAVLALWPKVHSIDGILKRIPKIYGRE